MVRALNTPGFTIEMAVGQDSCQSARNNGWPAMARVARADCGDVAGKFQKSQGLILSCSILVIGPAPLSEGFGW